MFFFVYYVVFFLKYDIIKKRFGGVMEKIINILKENQATISFNSLNIICDSYFIYKDKKDAIIRTFKLNGLIDDKKNILYARMSSIRVFKKS